MYTRSIEECGPLEEGVQVSIFHQLCTYAHTLYLAPFIMYDVLVRTYIVAAPMHTRCRVAHTYKVARSCYYAHRISSYEHLVLELRTRRRAQEAVLQLRDRFASTLVAQELLRLPQQLSDLAGATNMLGKDPHEALSVEL